MQKYLSVDEAASLLDVHSRTILRWIKQGELKAAKAGRQWRIRREDLDHLMGEPEKDKEAKCSAVLDLPVANRGEADRYQTLITASLNSRRNSDGVHHRVDCLYDEENNNLRFVLWGSINFMKDFFTLMNNY